MEDATPPPAVVVGSRHRLREQEVEAFFLQSPEAQRTKLLQLLAFRDGVQAWYSAFPFPGGAKPAVMPLPTSTGANASPIVVNSTGTAASLPATPSTPQAAATLSSSPTSLALPLVPLSTSAPQPPASPSAASVSSLLSSLPSSPRSSMSMTVSAPIGSLPSSKSDFVLYIRVMFAKNVLRKSNYHVAGTYCLLSVGKKYKQTSIVKGKHINITFDEGIVFHKIKQKKILSLELKDTAGLGREHSIGVLNLLVSDMTDKVEERLYNMQPRSSGGNSGASALPSALLCIRYCLRPIDSPLEDSGMLEVSQQVFGAPLEEVLEREQQNIPVVVTKCIDALQHAGLHHEGMFRISGTQEEISSLRTAIDRGEAVGLNFRAYSVHTVCDVLKLYLSLLPEPLLTFSQANAWMQLAQLGDSDEKEHAMMSLISKLPKPNRDLLEVLCLFLCRVAAHCQYNKMSLENLGILFGALLLRSNEDLPVEQQLLRITCAAQVTAYMLSKCDVLFSEPRSQTRFASSPMVTRNTSATTSSGSSSVTKERSKPPSLLRATDESLAEVLANAQAAAILEDVPPTVMAGRTRSLSTPDDRPFRMSLAAPAVPVTPTTPRIVRDLSPRGTVFLSVDSESDISQHSNDDTTSSTGSSDEKRVAIHPVPLVFTAKLPPPLAVAAAQTKSRLTALPAPPPLPLDSNA